MKIDKYIVCTVVLSSIMGWSITCCADVHLKISNLLKHKQLLTFTVDHIYCCKHVYFPEHVLAGEKDAGGTFVADATGFHGWLSCQFLHSTCGAHVHVNGKLLGEIVGYTKYASPNWAVSWHRAPQASADPTLKKMYCSIHGSCAVIGPDQHCEIFCGEDSIARLN